MNRVTILPLILDEEKMLKYFKEEKFWKYWKNVPSKFKQKFSSKASKSEEMRNCSMASSLRGVWKILSFFRLGKPRESVEEEIDEGNFSPNDLLYLLQKCTQIEYVI